MSVLIGVLYWLGLLIAGGVLFFGLAAGTGLLAHMEGTGFPWRRP